MHPTDCPNWEYEDHSGHEALLTTRAAKVIAALRRKQLDTRALAEDSRSVHAVLFTALTPPKHPCFAGNYRGSNYRCLRHYAVHIESDPRVGYPPTSVSMMMTGEMKTTILAGIAALDEAHAKPDAEIPPADKLLYVVAFACRVFDRFLVIHPYANGNGHAARFIVWAILGRFGYWPVRWPIEPRPPDPPYTKLLRQHRDGDCEPLEQWPSPLARSDPPVLSRSDPGRGLDFVRRSDGEQTPR